MPFSTAELSTSADGEAHIFGDGTSSYQLMAVSTTGCFAVRLASDDAAAPPRIHHWYFRSTGKDPIIIDPEPWLMVWPCKAPWDASPCGRITRLHLIDSGLVSLDVRGLTHLAHLRCSGNALQHLDCSGMAHLMSLDVTGNNLTHLDLTGCPRLERLRVGGNPGLPTHGTLLAQARAEPRHSARKALTSTSLFDV